MASATSIETPAVMSVDPQTGKLKVARQAPGDDTTTRYSALMSEQPIHVVSTRPPSPIRWTSVTFLRTSHRQSSRFQSLLLSDYNQLR